MINVRVGLLIGALCVSVQSVGAQSAAPPSPTPPATSSPTQADVDRLEAKVFELEVRLAAAEHELGVEKSKRAVYDTEGLKAKANTLRPNVRVLLGLPVTEKPSPPPAASPSEKSPPKD